MAVQTGTTYSIVQMSIGRFIAGLGVGALSGKSGNQFYLSTFEASTRKHIAIVPLYNGETAPKKIRGMMLVMYQLQIIMGLVAVLFAHI